MKGAKMGTRYQYLISHMGPELFIPDTAFQIWSYLNPLVTGIGTGLWLRSGFQIRTLRHKYVEQYSFMKKKKKT
jgi:hypothetical protein